MTTGLILGKFMPFHQGHIALIDFGLANTDKLNVLVCAHPGEPISGELRFNWVKEYYEAEPKIKVHYVTYNASELPSSSAASEDASLIWASYLKKKFSDTNVFISSEPYGPMVAAYWGINYLVFDEKREQLNISATAIREQPFAFWQRLPAIVRPYFVKKICIAGTESTGKSTLTQRLASYFNTVYVPEKARDIIAHTNDVVLQDLYRIAALHAKAIKSLLPRANKILFVDTDLTITKSYSKYLFDEEIVVDDWIEEANRFDLYLYLETDCPFVQDGTRLDIAERLKLDSFHKQQFQQLQITYHSINGSWEQRFLTAVDTVARAFFEKK